MTEAVVGNPLRRVKQDEPLAGCGASSSSWALAERERDILAYLVTSGTRHFTDDDDGGYAVTLISRRLVHLAGVPGQVFDRRNVPFAVHPDIWKELLRRKDDFRHPDTDSPQPWRIPWLAR